MAKTSNYQWDLPSPTGIQISEISRIATTFSAIDIKVKSFETALSAHKHAFSDLTDRPTTLGGYGITDGMTAQEVADAIKTAVDELIDGSSTALDTLKELADALGNDPDFATSVGEALGVRVRVDAAQSFSAAQKSRGRSNIDAVGTGDVGISVAPLGSDGKVPSGYLPTLTTTATVGAAVAGANSKQTPADGDFFTGVEAGGSTMFKTTWGNIKAALASIFYNKTEVNSIVSGNMSGRAYPRTAAGAALDVNWGQVQAQPRHILGAATDSPDVRPYAPSAITVGSASWAEAAGRANALTGGWTPDYIQNQLNWRVTDTRFNGYIEHNFIVPETGNFPNEVPGANGYTVTGIWMWAPGRNIGVSFRQPQIHIPNVGWRALGSW